MSDKLPDRVHDNIFRRKIIPNELGKVKPAKGQPKVFMLGGQPGAGKSGMTRNIEDTLAAGKTDAVKIDMDEFRIYHPDYLKFVGENPRTAADRVQEDVRKWAAELYYEALKRRINVIYDGTLTKQAEGMVKSADQEGYAIEVHVVATSLEASQQGVRNRYEEALEAYNADPHRNAPPRNVPDDVQRSAYNGIPGNLEALCKTGLVSRVRVASRSGDSLCDLIGKTKVKRDGGTSATRALKEERTRVWTAQEIYEYIERGKKIVRKMEARGENKKEIEKVRKAHGTVIDERVKVLDEDNKKKDSWIERIFKFDVRTLNEAAPIGASDEDRSSKEEDDTESSDEDAPLLKGKKIKDVDDEDVLQSSSRRKDSKGKRKETKRDKPPPPTSSILLPTSEDESSTEEIT